VYECRASRAGQARHRIGVYPLVAEKVAANDVRRFCHQIKPDEVFGTHSGLTSKIHAVVDTNGLPVRLALTAGEAHDNRSQENSCSNRLHPLPDNTNNTKSLTNDINVIRMGIIVLKRAVKSSENSYEKLRTMPRKVGTRSPPS
jgi:hypothetical protein